MLGLRWMCMHLWLNLTNRIIDIQEKFDIVKIYVQSQWRVVLLWYHIFWQSSIQRGRHTQLCIITSLKWIIQICSNFYWWVSKIAFYPPNPHCCLGKLNNVQRLAMFMHQELNNKTYLDSKILCTNCMFGCCCFLIPVSIYSTCTCAIRITREPWEPQCLWSYAHGPKVSAPTFLSPLLPAHEEGQCLKLYLRVQCSFESIIQTLKHFNDAFEVHFFMPPPWRVLKAIVYKWLMVDRAMVRDFAWGERLMFYSMRRSRVE